MAKNYFGVVLTTKEHDKYRLVLGLTFQMRILRPKPALMRFGNSISFILPSF